jgi:hypothetical protein
MMNISRKLVAVVSFVVMILAFGSFLVLRDGSVVLGGTHDAQATLRFEPVGSPKLNQPYVVKVIASSPRDNLNSVGIYMRFDPQKLRVNEMDTLKSFCQFYPEKKFDNQLGYISLACGAPHPGVRGEIELMTLTFFPLLEGNSQILVDGKSALLRSDGKGTNVLTDYPSLEVSPGVSF